MNLIKNQMGVNTGKAIITYSKEESVDAAVKKFNNFAVDSEINLVRPFFDKKEDSSRN